MCPTNAPTSSLIDPPHQSRHVYFSESVKSEIVKRRVEHLHDLGKRSLLEFLIEFVGGDEGLQLDLDILLERYSRLSQKMIDAVDGRDINRPLFVVNGDVA